MFAPEHATPIHDAAYAQAATFAIEYALAELWRSWGVEPAVVLGHSLGEYAAACVAGMLTLDDALRLVAERGRLTQMLSEDGAMGAVFAAEEVVAAEVARNEGVLAIAAYNGPEHFVISGRRTSCRVGIDPAGSKWRARETASRALCRTLATRRADPSGVPASPRYGSLQTPPHRAGVERERRIRRIRGNWLVPATGSPTMRAPVRFASAMQTLAAQGITHFIEIGPHPVLLGMGAECVPGDGVEWLPSLRRDRADWSDLLESLQRLYIGGADVDWNGFDRGYRRRRIALPTYPFRRGRHWMDVVGQRAATPIPARGSLVACHHGVASSSGARARLT